MIQHSFIRLVGQSTVQDITLQGIKDLFTYYKQVTSKTGEQLSWKYSEAAFPYEIKERTENNHTFLELTSTNSRYHKMYVGVHQDDPSTIFVSIPESATYGDKGKANEFCKFIAKKLAGELHLFNGRIMYFQKR